MALVLPPPDAPDLTRRHYTVKLPSSATDGSAMLFEEVVPPGTKSTFHLHHDSDEVAYVLAGEITFWVAGKTTVGRAGDVCFMRRGLAHAWKSTGAEAGHLLFVYTPGKAGGLIEEQTRRPFSERTPQEVAEIWERYGWQRLEGSPL
jgi:quercetin dioxygenase-like cupin family protein